MERRRTWNLSIQRGGYRCGWRFDAITGGDGDHQRSSSSRANGTRRFADERFSTIDLERTRLAFAFIAQAAERLH
jgi:hypothetical protein